jgi:hypothetical protein
VIALVAVQGARADQTYSDPAEDSGGAPDLTTTVVSNDPANNVTFRVSTNQVTLALDAVIGIILDADASPATGNGGYDYVIAFFGSQPVAILLRWDGTNFVATAAPTLRGSYASSVLTVTINGSDIGGISTGHFFFGIDSIQLDAAGNEIAEDIAPNDVGGATFVYVYELSRPACSDGQDSDGDGKVDFPADPGCLSAADTDETDSPPPSVLKLEVDRPVGVPAKPVAGKPFAVVAPVVRSDGRPFRSGKVRCTVRVGTKLLRATGHVANEVARCAMKVPNGTKGKTLRGTMTVQAGNAKAVTKAFVFPIA